MNCSVYDIQDGVNDMRKSLEQSYGFIFRNTLRTVNPLKRKLVATECVIHKYINMKALEILYNDRYYDEYQFFGEYISYMNAGVVWADQDFKSSGHFYNPMKNRGLYGNFNALTLGSEYYKAALYYWRQKQDEKALFYLGAAVHLVQDMTVPQHANLRLLDDHRQYENYIRRTYLYMPQFTVNRGTYPVESYEEALKCSATTSLKVYRKLRHIEEDERRFYMVTRFVLPLALRTTAGTFVLFYRESHNYR